MAEKIYVETTIPSYLTARLSRDLVVAAHQELTVEWWTRHRHRFDLFVSARVLEEAAAGDVAAASRRLQELKGIPVLDVTGTARDLAAHFLEARIVPANAVEDALHIAVATVHGMDYLLTWNCRHIANAEAMRRLADIAAQWGCVLPALCTPEQLMGN